MKYEHLKQRAGLLTELQIISEIICFIIPHVNFPYKTSIDERLIFRDYLMAFWLSPEVSTRDPIISPRALARGLIMVEG